MLDTAIFIIIGIVLFESIAMSCIQNYNLTEYNGYMIFAVLAYSVVCFFLHKTLYYDGIAKVNILWSGLSVVASTLMGVMFFKEELRYHDYLAILMIAIGVIILKWV